MSRKLLAFLLSELRTVRLICQKPGCGIVTELQVDQLTVACAKPVCPVCKSEFIGPNTTPDNSLTKLATVIRELRVFKDSVQIEFVLSDESEPEAKK